MSVEYYTAGQVSMGTGLPIGTVYRLASTKGWRKRDRFRPVRYLRGDVEKTMRERDENGDRPIETVHLPAEDVTR